MHHSAGVHRLLGPAASPYSFRPVQSQLTGERWGKKRAKQNPFSSVRIAHNRSIQPSVSFLIAPRVVWSSHVSGVFDRVHELHAQSFTVRRLESGSLNLHVVSDSNLQSSKYADLQKDPYTCAVSQVLSVEKWTGLWLFNARWVVLLLFLLSQLFPFSYPLKCSNCLS